MSRMTNKDILLKIVSLLKCNSKVTNQDDLDRIQSTLSRTGEKAHGWDNVEGRWVKVEYLWTADALLNCVARGRQVLKSSLISILADLEG